jgi:hypothetical protein
MLGDRHQRCIEHAPLRGRRHRSGNEQPEMLGEAEPAHELAHQIAPADQNGLGVRARDGRAALLLPTDSHLYDPPRTLFRIANTPSIFETILNPRAKASQE